MPSERIYHLALAADWGDGEADYRGSTLGQSLDEVGFVHCSTAAQVAAVADLFYRGRDDVVLLEVDPDLLAVPVRYEAVDEGGEQFPHVYGPIPAGAVVSARLLRTGKDGQLDLGG